MEQSTVNPRNAVPVFTGGNEFHNAEFCFAENRKKHSFRWLIFNGLFQKIFMCTCAPREGLEEGMDVLLHSFLTSEIERNEWIVSRPGQFTPTEKSWDYT